MKIARGVVLNFMATFMEVRDMEFRVANVDPKNIIISDASVFRNKQRQIL